MPIKSGNLDMSDIYRESKPVSREASATPSHSLIRQNRNSKKKQCEGRLKASQAEYPTTARACFSGNVWVAEFVS